jgi:GNAT superfamily N-acetyltransferase
MPALTLRAATRDDVATVRGLLRELAEFENLLERAQATEADLLRDGFGERPYFEVLLAELDGDAVGLALFYPVYSTFEGRPGLYVEDLYVTERARGQGIGRQLMARLAALALERGYSRLALAVLDWNPARDFYHRLGFTHTADWLPYRLDGEALQRLAAGDGCGDPLPQGP